MKLMRYEPWGLLNQFHRDLDNLFNTTEPSLEGSSVATSSWTPAVDIKEEPNQFVIEADIPGVEPKDIEISMENGVLTIKGERNSESQEESKGYKRVERIRGSFYRRFSLPDTADPENIKAAGKHGVLSVTIPKREVMQARKIEVEVS